MSEAETTPFYETDAVLAEYLLFHYGKGHDVLPFSFGPHDALDYPIRCVRECLDLECLPRKTRALDLGCAVGRSSFEFARHFQEVIGIDNSSRFIAAANTLRENGSLAYSCRTEGNLTVSLTAEVPPEIARERVHFQVADALNLPADIGRFDAVLLANLIDRLPRPTACLEGLADRVTPGGQLIVASPYTWMEEFTPRDEWLGGFLSDRAAITTLDSLKRILTPAFELIDRKDLPFLIREHVRKYQWSVAEATIWRRRDSR